MCPLYPLHLIFTWGFLLLFFWISVGQTWASALGNSTQDAMNMVISWSDPKVNVIDVNEGENKNITFYLEDIPPDALGHMINLQEASKDGLAHVKVEPDVLPLEYDVASGKSGPNTFQLSGSFLGFSKIRLVLSNPGDEDHKELNLGADLHEESRIRDIDVKVHRETTTMDIIFVHVVVILVLIAYINMGCAISIDVIKENVRRPFAPAIGLASQYLFMPLVSFGLGWLLFSSRPELWLGLFLTGCAPGGGGSNMWTYILGGSLDLSITMTFISTVFAFAALPLWVYALGPFIFPDGYYGKLPYRNIAILALGIVIPCCIGICIRRWCPKLADILKKALKPIAIFFIVFIMTFGVYAKFYLFSFFNWQVVVAGICLPLFGYLFGGAVSLLLGRKPEDVIAISVETGIQNSGLAIGVLKIALSQFSPMEDIAIVLPVAVATFSPVPLFICLLIKFIKDRRSVYLSKEKCSNQQNGVCDANSNSNIKLLNGNSKPEVEYA